MALFNITHRSSPSFPSLEALLRLGWPIDSTFQFLPRQAQSNVTRHSLGWRSQKEDLHEIKGLWWSSSQVGRTIGLFSEVDGTWGISSIQPCVAALEGPTGRCVILGQARPGELAYSSLAAFCRPAGFALAWDLHKGRSKVWAPAYEHLIHCLAPRVQCMSGN